MFFRRRLLDEGFLFPDEYKMIGDAVFIWNLLKAGKRTAVLHEPLAAFTFTGANLGQTEKASKEAAGWRGRADAPLPLLKWPAIVAHRLQKWMAGAYERRTLSYSIYTRDSIDKRKQFTAESLGWDWPR